MHGPPFHLAVLALADEVYQNGNGRRRRTTEQGQIQKTHATP